MTEDTQKLESALFNFRQHYDLSLPDLSKNPFWNVFNAIDLASQEHQNVIAKILEQIEEKEGLSSACSAAQSILRHTLSMKNIDTSFAQKKFELLITKLLYQDESDALKKLFDMTRISDNKSVSAKFGATRILDHIESLLTSNRDKAADILQRTYEVEADKDFGPTIENRKIELVHHIASTAYPESHPETAFKLITNAYKRAPKGSRIQGYLMESLLPLMESEEIAIEDRFATTANIICELNNSFDSLSPLAKKFETTFETLKKDILEKDPIQTLFISKRTLGPKDRTSFHEGSLCKRTIGRTLIESAHKAFEGNEENAQTTNHVLLLLEEAYENKQHETEADFFNKIADTILSLAEKGTSSIERPTIDCLKKIFYSVDGNSDLFQKTVKALENRIKSTPKEQTEFFIRNIWAIGLSSHAPLIKSETADRLYLKAVQTLSGEDQGQALEYMFKKIPFTTNRTLVSRKIAVGAFQETLKKNYKENPDGTLSLINSFFEDRGHILSEDDYSYMRTMFISLFEEIKLDKESLSKNTQDILYPEKPKKIQLAVSAFIKEAKP